MGMRITIEMFTRTILWSFLDLIKWLIDGWEEGFAKPDLILDQLWLNGLIWAGGILILLNIERCFGFSFYVALHWKEVGC